MSFSFTGFQRIAAAKISGLALFSCMGFWLLCLGTVVGSANTTAGPRFGNYPITEQKLTNGIRLLALEDRQSPFINILVAFKAAGIPTDSKLMESGLLQVLSGLLPQQTEGRSPLAIAEIGQTLGANLSCSPGAIAQGLQIVCSMQVLGSDLELALDLVNDVTRNSKFSNELIEREFRRQKSMAQGSLSNPSDWLEEKLTEILFEGHPLSSLTRLGLMERSQAFTLEQVQALRDFLVRPENTEVIVLGAETQSLLSKVQTVFTDWAKTSAIGARSLPALPANISKKNIFFVSDLAQQNSFVFYRALPRSFSVYGAEHAGLALGIVPLGQFGIEDRLNKVVRAEKGLTYGVGAYFRMGRVLSTFEIGGQATREADKAAEFYRDIISITQNWGANGLTDEGELRSARTNLRVSLESQFEPGGARLLQQLTNVLNLSGNTESYRRFTNFLIGNSLSVVNDAIKKYFGPRSTEAGGASVEPYLGTLVLGTSELASRPEFSNFTKINLPAPNSRR